MLRRFILCCPFRPLHHSTPIFQANRSLAISLRSAPSITSSPFSSRAPLFFPTPRAISQKPSVDFALLDAAPFGSERDANAGGAACDAEGLKNSSFGVIRTPPRPPILTVKEKKELASYAHSLGRRLKSQQVGKSGVTDAVVTALIETLEANELLKLRIHGTCPGELDDVVNQLEASTGSGVVGQIGRTVIPYRPSLTKLKAEENRELAQSAHLGKQSISKQAPQGKRPVLLPGPESQQHGCGGRGSTRF